MKCPESLEELNELERMLPLCKATLYDQAKAKIKNGAAHSISEASCQLGEEMGRKPEAIRTSIKREQKNRTGSLNQLAGTDKHCPNNHFRTSFTGDNEWYTPIEYVESARQVMGSIDLDPATSEFAQNKIKASKAYSIKEDGLSLPWEGNVWLNPPYSQPAIQQFIEKAVAEWAAEGLDQMIILTHNYTDTAWFHLAESHAALICFTRGRIKFEKAAGIIAAPTQGSAFFYFGNQVNKFKEIFGKYGFVR